jgi:hypothetical protein
MGHNGPMPRRLALAVLSRPRWTPPGVDPWQWRLALAEDALDGLAVLASVEVGVAVDAAGDELDTHDLLARVGWPGLRRYGVPGLDVTALAGAAAADGFEHVALIAGDAPDLPSLVIAKLFRPLTTKPAAVALAAGAAPGLLGLGLRLPVPAWLPRGSLDALTPVAVRRAAPRPTDVGSAPGWHRLRTPEDLQRLDPRVEGWDCTRTLLSIP